MAFAAVVAVVGWALERWWLDPWARERLAAEVYHSTEGRYQLQIGDLNLLTPTATGVIRDAYLAPSDSAARNWPDSLPQWRVRIPRLRLGLVNYLALLRHKQLRMGGIRLYRPMLVRIPSERDVSPPDSAERKWEDELLRMTRRVFPGGVRIDEVRIEGLRMELRSRYADGRGAHALDSLDLVLRGIRLDQPARNDTSRLAFANHVDITARNYRFRDLAGEREIGFDLLTAHYPQRAIQVRNFRVQPLQDPVVFSRQLRYQRDWMTLRLPEARVEGIRFRELVEQGQLHVRRVQLRGLQVDIYHDKHPEKDPNRPPRMPHEALQAAAHPPRIDSLELTQGYIRYRELNQGAADPGTIWFSGIAVQAQHLRADSAAPQARIHASAMLQGEGRLEVDMRYALAVPSLQCRFQGRLGPMPATAANPIVKPNLQVAFQRGQVQAVTFAVQLRGQLATGNLLAKYDNLNVAVLKPQEGEPDSRRGLVSALANLLIKNNRSRAEQQDTVGIRYERERQDSFVRLMWRALRDGLTQSLLPIANRSERIAQRKRQQRQASKPLLHIPKRNPYMAKPDSTRAGR